MKIFFVLALFLLAWGEAFACPMCAGAKGNEGSQYLVYILMGFIALTYIPFYFIYRMIIKNRNPDVPAGSDHN